MIRVVTPQGELLAKLENSAVAAYLKERGLVGRKKSSSAEVDAYDASIEAHLLEMEKPSSVVIHRFDKSRIRAKLVDGKTVYVKLKWNEMVRGNREIMPFHAFIFSIKRFTDAESPVEIVIPPGRYGDRYVFALRKA